MQMISIRLALCACIFLMAGCSRQPTNFKKLNIQDVEGGPVPASTVPNAPPQEGVVVYTREKAGIVKVVYRKTVQCPTRMITSMSGIEVQPDRIVLCFEPVESSDPKATPLSGCPYNLVIKHELTGIPESVEPKFEVKDGCAKSR